MENLFKKFLYTGVGLVASTAEKVQSNITETVEKQKVTESEGEKVVTDLRKDTEAKFNEMEERLRSTLDSALARFNLPNKEEMQVLKTRIAELEAELAKKEAVAVEATKEVTKEITKEVVEETEKVAPKKTTARRRTTRKKAE